jgi:hypothetical protein
MFTPQLQDAKAPLAYEQAVIAVDARKQSYDFAKKTTVGLMNSFDLNQSQLFSQIPNQSS